MQTLSAVERFMLEKLIVCKKTSQAVGKYVFTQKAFRNWHANKGKINSNTSYIINTACEKE